VRGADGQLVSGAAAFAAIWRRLPAYAWLGRLASPRPVQWLLEGGYRGFLTVRRLWRPAPVALGGALPAPLVPLRDLLEACRGDEVAHRDEAAARAPREPGLLMRSWARVVGSGSALAVRVSRRF